MASPKIDTWNPENGIMPPPEDAPSGDSAPAPEPATATAESSNDAPQPADPSPDSLSKGVESLQVTQEQAERNEEDSGEAAAAMADYSFMRKFLQNQLLHASVEIEVQRANKDSPLYSVKSFEELNLPKQLLQGIIAMGFTKPSKIQETALPILLARPPQNLIAQSQSGTGKTAAFLLASLSRVDTTQAFPQVLILSPTYELAKQTGEVAMKMAKYMTDLRFKFAVRGEEIARGDRVTSHVILGTPGKVMDWVLKYKFFDSTRIKVFVLDEADVMIDTQGHRQQSLRIQRTLSHDCQILFFSATYNQPVMEFADQIVNNPLIIQLKKEEESLDNINQYYIMCRDEQSKYDALFNLFGTLDVGQMFIFVGTKRCAHTLYDRLTSDGFTVGLISGDLTVEERTHMLNKFRDGQQRVVIATNLLARGIDISGVTVVINYDLPIHPETKDIDYETYLHRIGRTGRFGKAGLAFNFVDPDVTWRMIGKLEQRFGKPIKQLDAQNTEEIGRINQ